MQQSQSNAAPLCLAWDTSTDFGAVAIGRGDRVLSSRIFSGPRRHAVEFIPAMSSLCEAHGVAPERVEHLYVGVGPGSFTGLRIGISAARTLALVSRAKVVAVPTLEAVAHNALKLNDPPDRVVVIIDAHRNHAYAAVFERHGPAYRPLLEPAEVIPAPFLASLDPRTAVLGEGVMRFRSDVERSGLPVLPDHLFQPDVETVYLLGRRGACSGVFVDPRDLVPHYVRPPEAEEKWRPESRRRP